jgi:hypothetical protein
MAELRNAGYGGSTLPAGQVTDHRAGGSHTVAGGVLTLTATTATDSQAIVRRASGVAFNVNDTLTFQVVSADGFRMLLGLRCAPGDVTFLPAISSTADGRYYTAYYRIATGLGFRVFGPNVADRPCVRFRRVSETELAVETAPVYSGPWTAFDTFLVSDGVWSPAGWTAVQEELGTTGGAGTVVITALGDGSDGGPAPVFTALEITGIPSSFTIGVLLPPITVRALDQFGATFTGPLEDCSAESLDLPFSVTGTLLESYTAGVAIFDNLTPVVLSGAPVGVITVATPLRCSVSIFPTTSAAIEASAGGAIPTLIARQASDHLLRVQGIRHAVTGATIVPTRIRYVLRDSAGLVVTSEVTTPTNPDDWQIALARGSFTPTRGPMVLTLTLVAPGDSTETALQFVVVQGVRQ